MEQELWNFFLGTNRRERRVNGVKTPMPREIQRVKQLRSVKKRRNQLCDGCGRKNKACSCPS